MATDDEIRRTLRHVADHQHVRLLDADYLTIDARWNVQNVRSGHWRLYVNNRSGADVRWAGGTYRLIARRIHFIPAWVHFHCHNVRPVQHFYLHFDMIGLPGAVVRSVFNRPFTLDKSPELETLADRVMSCLSELGADDLRTAAKAKGLTHLALAELFDQLPAEDRLKCHEFVVAPGRCRRRCPGSTKT